MEQVVIWGSGWLPREEGGKWIMGPRNQLSGGGGLRSTKPHRGAWSGAQSRGGQEPSLGASVMTVGQAVVPTPIAVGPLDERPGTIDL